jgi:Protein of unknown function (DUF4236)
VKSLATRRVPAESSTLRGIWINEYVARPISLETGRLVESLACCYSVVNSILRGTNLPVKSERLPLELSDRSWQRRCSAGRKMGLFFRKSVNIGPFRLNVSKSGIGASVGFKGARITRTARGTTYVTMGGGGIYYRETISSGGRTQSSNRPSQSGPFANQVENPGHVAEDIELVDSSSENLVRQLNERASLFNPAWILFFLSFLLCLGASIAYVVQRPNLPGVTRPFSQTRRANITDEYAKLVAYYGNPDSVLSAPKIWEKGSIPTWTVRYDSAQVAITLVPAGCLEAYEAYLDANADTSRYPSIVASEIGGIQPCNAPVNAGWTIVDYVNTAENWQISAESASRLLDTISVRRAADPAIQFSGPPNVNQKSSPKSRAKKRERERSDIAALQERLRFASARDTEALASEQKNKESAEFTSREESLIAWALLVAGLCISVAAVIVHRKNAEKRTSRLIYDLSEKDGQTFALVTQALEHLSRSHRIWRIESRSCDVDWKRNAGAAYLVNRKYVRVCTELPARVEANVTVKCLDLASLKVYFLPDMLLILSNGRYGSIAYRDFKVEEAVTNFIEDDGLPADATVVGQTWRFVNKNGAPDRRFSNNRQLPIAEYGVLHLRLSEKLDFHLNTSSAQTSLAFAQCWHELEERTGYRPSPKAEPTRSRSPRLN